MTKQPQCDPRFLNPQVEIEVSNALSVINLIRSARDKVKIPVKNPLPEAIVFCQNQAEIDNITRMSELIVYDSNVKKVTPVDNVQDNKFGIKLVAQANTRKIGSRLQKKAKEVFNEISRISQADLFKFQSGQTIQVNGHDIFEGDLTLSYVIDESMRIRNFMFITVFRNGVFK